MSIAKLGHYHKVITMIYFENKFRECTKLLCITVLFFFVSCNEKESNELFSNEQKVIYKALSEPTKVIDYDFCTIAVYTTGTSQNIVNNEQSIKAIMKIGDNQLNSFNVYITGLRIALEAEPNKCANTFIEGEKIFTASYKELAAANRLNWPKPDSNDFNIKVVQENILELAISDQAVRNTWTKLNLLGENKSLAEKWAEVEAADFMQQVDEEATEYMADILNRIGWLEKSEYGEYTSFFAWLLIQHSDSRPEVQKQALRLAEPLLETGEVSKSDYAYLVDRVAVNTGNSQVYGTQSTGKCVDGKPEMRPIAKLGGLYERRKLMKLGSFDDYLLRLSKTICKNDPVSGE